MYDTPCPECAAAHNALLDQIVEHKVQLEELKDRVAEIEMVLDDMLAAGSDDEDEEDDEEDE